jgi:hypothetical protein
VTHQVLHDAQHPSQLTLPLVGAGPASESPVATAVPAESG